MGCIWQTIYDILAKTIGYNMGYIGQQLWDIFSQNNQKYYGIYWLKIVGYICKTMEYWSFGYIKQNQGIY